MPARNELTAPPRRGGRREAFSTRLLRVLRESLPGDVIVEVWTRDLHPRPASDYDHDCDARVTASAFEGVREGERQSRVWQAVLDHLWAEQEKVGTIMTFTPDELDAVLAAETEEAPDAEP